MTIYSAEAEGDTVFMVAKDENDAYDLMCFHFGAIPKSMIAFTVVDELPEGEELLPDVRG